jgi:hypothetical protein
MGSILMEMRFCYHWKETQWQGPPPSALKAIFLSFVESYLDNSILDKIFQVSH